MSALNELPAEEGNPPGQLPNGRLNLKVPRTLHRDLRARAEHENISLNQLVVYLLAQGLRS